MKIIDGTGKSRPLSFPERLDPASTALIVIDVQNDFCTPGFACDAAGDDLDAMAPLIEPLKALIETARGAEVLTIFVRASYDPPVLSPALAEIYQRRGFTKGICLEGTEGIDFVDGTGPVGAPNERVLTKHRFSAWWGTELDLILRSNGIGTVVLTGVVTEGCVESTARDAFFKDYRVVIAEDCVAGFSRDRHNAALAKLGTFFGRVVPAAAIGAEWSKARPGPRGWHERSKRAALLDGLPERVDAAHTAIIMIDVQNDFFADAGMFRKRGFGVSNMQAALPNMLALLEAGRNAGCMMVHIRSDYHATIRHVGSPYRHPADNVEGSTATISAARFQPGERFDPTFREVCNGKEFGGQWLEGFHPRPGEISVRKNRISAFQDTPLELLLRSNGIRTVIIGGVTTNCCVETAARAACMLDFNVVVAEDAVGAADEIKHLHDASLETMAAYFARVEPVRAIVEAMPLRDWKAA